MVYIPGFLAAKVYDRGSLRNTAGGFEFAFSNRMTPVRISGLRDIRVEVDGVRYPAGSLELTLAGQPVSLSGGRLDEPVTFGKGAELVVRVRGSRLSAGRHRIRTSFITNEYGGATLKVSDRIGAARRCSPLRWLLRLLLGGARDSRREPTGPVQVSGELGGVPLDPDFERLAAVLRREEPDRVPLFEADIAVPIQEWFLGREIADARDEVEFYVQAGYDYVPVVPPFFAPRLMRSASEDGAAEGEGDDDQRTWVLGSEGLIRSVADVEAFPWPRAEEVDFSAFYDIGALLPPKMKLLGLLAPAAVFGNASQAMGLENFAYALYDDPAVVEALFQITGSTYLAITERLVQVPKVGAVLMADDLSHAGGCLVSPEVYRKYVFPWYRRIGEVLDGAGIPFIFHSDGKLWEVLDDLADCGIKAIHPIEPQAMDIVEVKRRYGDRFCIFGNVDLDHTLTQGSVEDVEREVRWRIAKLGPGGGWGLSASNSVPDYAKPENFRAMVEATRRYGAYPIAGV